MICAFLLHLWGIESINRGQIRYFLGVTTCRMEGGAKGMILIEVFVVDKDFEQFGQSGIVVRYEVDVGYDCRNEARLSFDEPNGVLLVQFGIIDRREPRLHRLSCLDGALAVQARIYNKGVVLEQLAVEGLCDIVALDREVRALCYCHVFVHLLQVIGTVSRVCAVVDGIDGFCGMQLARTSVKPWSVIIEYAVSDVATLLNLCQSDSSADGMYATGRDEEHVAPSDFVTLQHVADGSVLHPFLILVLRDGLAET